MKKYAPEIILLVIVIFTHYNWFFSDDIITSGDWGFHNGDAIKEWFSKPYAWDIQKNMGDYNTLSSFYGFKIIYGMLETLGIHFNISERLLFLWPSALIATFGMYYLSKRIFENSLASFFSSLIYSINTYILLVQGLGHLTIAMAYALLPVIFLYFKLGLEKHHLRYMIISGLLLAISWFYEPRIGYIISAIMMIYILFFIFSLSKKDIKKYLTIMPIPFIITFIINIYWIIPSFTIKYSNVRTIFPEDPWISWMNVTHAALLYHPFWTGGAPKIFSIVQPNMYMIFLPLLAFGPILFLRRKNIDRKFIAFLLLIASIGIILVKQENEPFGYIYTWLFHNFPGFNMFREASKFYILIAFSYSLLIGFSINEINKKVVKNRLEILNMIFLFFILILIFYTAKPTFLGQMKGTYKTVDIPEEYLQLNMFIENQSDFFRTYWYPTNQRFGYYSNNHPIMSHVDLIVYGKFGDIFRLQDALELPDKILFDNFIDATSVKYIIVPYDSEREIYKNYGKKNDFIKNMESYSFQKINIENTNLFENKDYQDRFYMIDSFFERIDDNWKLNFAPLINITFNETEGNLNGYSDVISLNSSSLDITKKFIIDVNIIPKYMNQSGDIIALRDGYNVQYGITYISNEKGIRFGTSLYNGENIYFFDDNVRPFDISYNVSAIYDGKYLKLYVDDEKVKQIRARGKLAHLKGDLLIGKSTLENTYLRGKVKNVKLSDISLDDYELKSLRDPDFPFNKSYLDNFHRIKKTNVNYTYINPTLYNIQANTTKPFMLVFADSYDPYWIAHVDKIDGKSIKSEKIHSTPLYSMINSFWINNTGNLSITIEYEPQNLFNIGFMISIMTFVGCIGYILYDRKNSQ